MALTLSSVFEVVTIVCRQDTGLPYLVEWRLDDVTSTVGLVNFGWSLGSLDVVNADWAVLRDIYESSSGFVDADGNVVVPTVRNFIHGTTPESMEEFGSFNPLHEGSYEQWLKSRQVEGILLQGTSRVGSGLLEIRHKGVGYIPVADQPVGDAYDYPVSDWIVAQIGDAFHLSLLVPYELTIDTVDKLNAYYPVQAMLSWLEAIRVAGTGLTVAPDITNASSFSGRTFAFRQQESDSEDLQFVLGSSPSIILDDIEGSYTRVMMNFELDTSNTVTLDVPAISIYMADVAIGTISTVGLLIDPNHGNSDVPYRTRKIIGPGRRSVEFISDTLVYTGRDPTMGMYRLPMAPGYGRSATWAYLDKNTAGQGYVPVNPSIDTVHLDNTVTGDLRFLDPTRHVISTNTHRVYTVHNIGTASRNIRDWNNDLIISLESSQSVQFLMSLEVNGDGELIVLHPPNRHYKIFDSNPGHLGDSPYFTDGSSLYRIVPLDNPGEYIDIDSFQRGDGSTLAAGAHVWADEEDWDFPEILEILKNGWLDINVGFDIELTSGVTGSIDTWNGARIYHQRGSALPTILVSSTKPAVSGAGAREQYYANWRVEVQTGDKVFFVFRYRTATNISWENVRVGLSYMIATLEPRIRVEYTA